MEGGSFSLKTHHSFLSLPPWTSGPNPPTASHQQDGRPAIAGDQQPAGQAWPWASPSKSTPPPLLQSLSLSFYLFSFSLSLSPDLDRGEIGSLCCFLAGRGGGEGWPSNPHGWGFEGGFLGSDLEASWHQSVLANRIFVRFKNQQVHAKSEEVRIDPGFLM